MAAALRRTVLGSIRRALLLLPLFVLAPVLLFQVWVFERWIRHERADEVGFNLEVARSFRTTVERYVEGLLREEATIGRLLLVSRAARLQPEETLGTLARYPGIRDVLWAAPSGRVLASAGAARGAGELEPHALALLRGGSPWAVSNLTSGLPGGRLGFVVARNIPDSGGRTAGIVAVVVEPSQLEGVLGFGRLEGGAVTLLDGHGQVVYRKPAVPLLLRDRRPPAFPELQAALEEGREVSFTADSPLDGIRRTFAAVPMPGLGWVALASRPVAVATRDAYREIRRSALELAAVACCSLLIAYLLARAISLPARRLEEYAAAVGSGRTPGRVGEGAPGELRRVAEALDRMLDQLKGREESRNRAEEALRASEERLRGTFENAAVGVTLSDPEGRWLDVNHRFGDLLGYAREELLGRRFQEFSPAEDVATELPLLNRLLGGELPTFDLDKRYVRRDGSVFWAHVTRSLLELPGSGRAVIAIVQDVSARKAAEDALRLSEERLRLSAEAGEIGTWDWDIGAGRLVWDPVIKALVGLAPEEEPSYERFVAVMHPEDRARVLNAVEESLETLGEYDAEYRIIRPDGQVRWLVVRGRAVPGAAGTAVRMIGIAMDVTRRKEYESALSRVRDAEVLDRAKSEFMAVASHELHTPLNSIIGYGELLLDEIDGPLNPDQRASVERIVAGGRRLVSLADAILDLSRMETAGLALSSNEFRLRERVEEALGAYEDRARRKGLSFACSFVPGLPAALRGDADRLVQALSLVLDNAVKFTDRGAIAVHVSKHSSLGRRECLQFTVADTGPGIPREKQESIFRPFEQAEAHETRSHEGMGLGLPICRGLVEKMGGRLWVESQPGRGSAFSFTACFELP